MKSWKLCALAAAAALAAGCRLNGPTPDGSGTIECTEVQVPSSVAGRILELPLQEGAAVKKGDLVARIDPADYILRRDEAAAGLAVAQAQLDLVLAGSREEDVQRARDQLREAQAADRAARADLDRIRQVFEAKSATQKQMDDAAAMADRTAAVASAAEQSLAKLLRGSRKEEIRVAQSQVDLAKARLAEAGKAVADCTVAAPMEGVVTARTREVGEWASPGAPLVTVSRLDEVWLAIYVPESRLAGIRLGQPGRVQIDGDAKPYEGTVTFLSPEAEFTPRNVQTPDERAKLVYRVKITLPNPNGVFKPGMPADGYLDRVGAFTTSKHSEE